MEDPVYPFWGILATAFYAGIFYWGIDQVNVQRALAAPNLHQARWGDVYKRQMSISLHGLDWIVGITVLLGSLAVGLYMAYSRRAGKDSSSFFLGGRAIKWPVIGASLFATNIGAEHLVGLSGDAYRYGLSAGTVELTTAITLGFACAILFPHYIKNKIFTIPEFLEIRYNRKRCV